MSASRLLRIQSPEIHTTGPTWTWPNAWSSNRAAHSWTTRNPARRRSGSCGRDEGAVAPAGAAGFAEPREDSVNAVVVRVGAHVRRGIDAQCRKVPGKSGIGEGTPGLLDHHVVARPLASQHPSAGLRQPQGPPAHCCPVRADRTRTRTMARPRLRGPAARVNRKGPTLTNLWRSQATSGSGSGSCQGLRTARRTSSWTVTGPPPCPAESRGRDSATKIFHSGGFSNAATSRAV